MPLIAFARQLGVDPLTVRRWVWDGLRGGIKLRAERRGGRLFVRQADYEAWQRSLDAPKARATYRRERGGHAAAMAWLRERGLLA